MKTKHILAYSALAIATMAATTGCTTANASQEDKVMEMAAETESTAPTTAEGTTQATPQNAAPQQQAAAKGEKEYDGTYPLPIGKGKPVIIDFYATWCGPCRAFAPIFKETAEKYCDKAEFYRVDVDKFPQLAEKYAINAIPTTIFFAPDGKYDKFTGLMDAAQLQTKVTTLIGAK